MKLFAPSSTDLQNMVKAAEAKFARDRKAALEERFELAHQHNARIIRQGREYDARRYVFAGDRR